MPTPSHPTPANLILRSVAPAAPATPIHDPFGLHEFGRGRGSLTTGEAILATAASTALNGTYFREKAVQQWHNANGASHGELMADILRFFNGYPDIDAPLKLLAHVKERFHFAEQILRGPDAYRRQGGAYEHEAVFQDLYAEASRAGLTWEFYGEQPEITAWIAAVSSAFKEKFSERIAKIDGHGGLQALVYVCFGLLDLNNRLQMAIEPQADSPSGKASIDSSPSRAVRPITNSLVLQLIKDLNLNVPNPSAHLEVAKNPRIIEDRCRGCDLGDTFILGLRATRDALAQLSEPLATLARLQEFDSTVHALTRVAVEKPLADRADSHGTVPLPHSALLVVVVPNSPGDVPRWAFFEGAYRRGILGAGITKESGYQFSNASDWSVAGEGIPFSDQLHFGVDWCCRWFPKPEIPAERDAVLQRHVAEVHAHLMELWEELPGSIAQSRSNDALILIVSDSCRYLIVPTEFELTSPEGREWKEESFESAAVVDAITAAGIFNFPTEPYRIFSRARIHTAEPSEGEHPELKEERTPKRSAQLREHFHQVGYPTYREFIQSLISKFDVIEDHHRVGKGAHGALFRQTAEGRRRFTTCSMHRSDTEKVKVTYALQILDELGISLQEYLAQAPQ